MAELVELDVATLVLGPGLSDVDVWVCVYAPPDGYTRATGPFKAWDAGTAWAVANLTNENYAVLPAELTQSELWGLGVATRNAEGGAAYHGGWLTVEDMHAWRAAHPELAHTSAFSCDFYPLV